ncbi:MAG: hypothetical protein QM811_23510 [Pirellulales bacterium]
MSGAADPDAAVPDLKAGQVVAAIPEDLAFVMDAVAVGVFENGEAIAAGLFPFGIAEALGDPDAAFIVDVDGDRLQDLRLGREAGHVEVLGERRFLQHLGRRRGRSFGVFGVLLENRGRIGVARRVGQKRLGGVRDVRHGEERGEEHARENRRVRLDAPGYGRVARAGDLVRRCVETHPTARVANIATQPTDERRHGEDHFDSPKERDRPRRGALL